MYYFTGSVPEYDRIVVRGASTLAGLATAAEIGDLAPAGDRAGWAATSGRRSCTASTAAGTSTSPPATPTTSFRIRMYVLESTLADPRDPAGWALRGQIVTEWDSFSLDATTFAHRGRRYLVWAQSEPEIAVNTSLYIAEMSSPLALAHQAGPDRHARRGAGRSRASGSTRGRRC